MASQIRVKGQQQQKNMTGKKKDDLQHVSELIYMCIYIYTIHIINMVIYKNTYI